MPFLPMGVPVPGAKGQLRASHRELDTEVSTALAPVHRHERACPLTPGEVVSVDVPIWPMGMIWHAGEQLELVISARDLLPTAALVTGPPVFEEDPLSEAGSVTVHTGEPYVSRLTVSRV
ncbi:CocE/NonD family hydrolase C-terminal non-catalytic domain-containing protein [Rhodococcus sp. P14]|uniref:CocE/NonD family hydrolase C-terminal non-catalytic domain-containing protein n=1 Tax=Rhodococcus sp. P14 TaxID=450821 RepID=UPI003FD11EBE